MKVGGGGGGSGIIGGKVLEDRGQGFGGQGWGGGGGLYPICQSSTYSFKIHCQCNSCV